MNHTFSDNMNLFSYSFGGQRSKIKARVRLVPSGGSRGESVPSHLQLLEVAGIPQPWLMAATLQSLLPLSHGPSLSFDLLAFLL